MMNIVANYIMQTDSATSCAEALQLAREAIYGMKSSTISSYRHGDVNITNNSANKEETLPLQEANPLSASRH